MESSRGRRPCFVFRQRNAAGIDNGPSTSAVLYALQRETSIKARCPPTETQRQPRPHHAGQLINTWQQERSFSYSWNVRGKCAAASFVKLLLETSKGTSSQTPTFRYKKLSFLVETFWLFFDNCLKFLNGSAVCNNSFLQIKTWVFFSCKGCSDVTKI